MKIEDRLFVVQILGSAARLIPTEQLTRTKLLNDSMQMLHNNSPATLEDVKEILDQSIAETFGFFSNVTAITEIKAAINEYYLALDTRQHGGVAQNKAFDRIQEILGMNWERGQQLSEWTCHKCKSVKVDPCGRGGKRCTECGETFGAD